MNRSKMIETGQWWDRGCSWNPTAGCSKISPACDNCYACDIHTKRHLAFMAGAKLPKQYAKPFNEIQLLPERLDKPLHWREPRIIFVDSMSDLFHKDVPFEFAESVWDTMFNSNTTNLNHTFLILTKRPERLLKFS